MFVFSVADIKLDLKLFCSTYSLLINCNFTITMVSSCILLEIKGPSEYIGSIGYQVVGASSGGVQWPKFTMEKPDPVLGSLIIENQSKHHVLNSIEKYLSRPGEVYAGKTSLSPELTLVEFISTSAAFHGVTSQLLTSLEEELLKVILFPFWF